MFSEIDNKYFYEGELGALYSKEETLFRVWSPMAEKIVLKLYESAEQGESSKVEFPMDKNRQGIWECRVSGDLDGIYYMYELLQEENSFETIDIYARACGVNGERGMVVDLEKTNPPDWEKQKEVPLRSPTDAVLYELHVRDFSIDKSGNFLYRGKYLAFTEHGIKNQEGQSIGIDHLTELGITHVHLLPVFDYKTVDETITSPQFNWGYDPQNFNIPEGSYSTNPYDGKARIRELKQLIRTLHNAGIGVVMDVVYNHTYDLEDSPFTKIFPHYYYRSFGEVYADGSACGNEFATQRKMAAKFIADSLCFWAKEYKIDGFRFDLMGLYDIDCMNLLHERLKIIKKDILLYGEGWTGGESPLSEDKRALKKNATKVSGIAMFSDDFRDAVKGDTFNGKLRGFVNGGNVPEESIRSVMVGGVRHPAIPTERIPWTDDPRQAVNYVEVHDNYTLWDKLLLSCPEANENDRIAMDKLAAAMVFLAQGIPFIQAGQEFLRSKPLNGGFDGNSYHSLDEVNSLKWDRKSTYASVFKYYQGLIGIRRQYDFFRMQSGEEIRRRIRFMDGLPLGIIGILYDEQAALYLNPSNQPIQVTSGLFRNVLADGEKASPLPMRRVEAHCEVSPRSILLLTL